MVRRFLIDTNIFLELLLNQEKADESLTFVNAVNGGELEAHITSFGLHYST